MNSTRRILLAVTGLTPQVVTETLYALAQRPGDPWVPNEIHLITTATGAENARLNLLAQTDGWFHRLCRDYALPPIEFTDAHIHALTDASGRALDDIRTPAENSLAADFITDMVRRFTEADHTELHVSIAGGRKTMGYYLGYALSLYGRPQDRLSHVLVSDPFENNRQFYYPTPYDHAIHVRRGEKEIAHNARHARIELAEIPFVSLRHGLPEALLTGQAGFHDTVQAARTALGPATLTLYPENRRILAAGKTFHLPPAQFALLAVFAYRAQVGLAPMRAPLKDVRDHEWAQTYLDNLTQACGIMRLPNGIEDTLRPGVDESYFSQHLSRLRATLKRQLGLAATPYSIDDGSTRPRQYRLALPAHAICFESVNDRGAGK
ncbi:MAG: CRISPR-associated ring nuclease Csm6 [Sulfuricellaceae bacterium]|nr:CRISPR-associated ring nuclease Csm6 [Sulfuricellaceae bacterium]